MAVIVVTYNSGRYLPKFLKSLTLGCDGVNYELIVVDNASTDNSIGIARNFDSATTKVVRSGGNFGYAAAINLGVKNCAMDTTAILVVNPDIEFEPNSVAALVRGLRTPGVGVAVPQPLDSSGARVNSIRRCPTVSRAFGEAILGPRRAGRYSRWGDLVTDPDEYTYEHNVSWAEGSAQLISAECWNECGEWDESHFLYSEETEFNLRVQDHGRRDRRLQGRGTHPGCGCTLGCAPISCSCAIFGYPGPLVDKITELGLEFIASPEPGKRPSPAVLAALTGLVEERSIEVIHGYEWPPAIESWLVAARQRRRVTAVGTVMSMSVAPFLPRTMPLVVGTEQIAAAERSRGRRLTAVIEPPVDVIANAPLPARDSDAFRSQHGMDDGALNVVTVTRLAHELKLEGLLVAIDTLPLLRGPKPIRLVIVGDGPARNLVADRAEAANRRVGRTAVILTGELTDPRPAYDTADVLLGMGGSALRSLAFAKPLVVQGERGFWRLLNEQTVDEFLWTGWYGVGEGPDHGPAALTGELAPLLADDRLRRELGRFGRELVERRFGLEAAAARQLRIYQAAVDLAVGPFRQSIDGARSTALYGRYVAARRLSRIRGRRSVDDFNSKPVVAGGPRRPGLSGVA